MCGATKAETAETHLRTLLNAVADNGDHEGHIELMEPHVGEAVNNAEFFLSERSVTTAISIEFSSSFEAKIIIDGFELDFGYKHGEWGFESPQLQGEIRTRTMAELIAIKIATILPNVLQGWAQPEEDEAGVWDSLGDNDLSAAARRMFRE